MGNHVDEVCFGIVAEVGVLHEVLYEDVILDGKVVLVLVVEVVEQQDGGSSFDGGCCVPKGMWVCVPVCV